MGVAALMHWWQWIALVVFGVAWFGAGLGALWFYFQAMAFGLTLLYRDEDD